MWVKVGCPKKITARVVNFFPGPPWIWVSYFHCTKVAVTYRPAPYRGRVGEELFPSGTWLTRDSLILFPSRLCGLTWPMVNNVKGRFVCFLFLKGPPYLYGGSSVHFCTSVQREQFTPTWYRLPKINHSRLVLLHWSIHPSVMSSNLKRNLQSTPSNSRKYPVGVNVRFPKTKGKKRWKMSRKIGKMIKPIPGIGLFGRSGQRSRL